MDSIYLQVRNAKHLVVILYLAVAGALCVFSFMHYMGESFQPGVGLIFMGIVFSIYILNRFSDAHEDFTNDISKYMFFSKRKFLYKLGIASMVLILVSLTAMKKLSAYHILLLSLGVLYSYRLVPWYSKKKGLLYIRLKELPFVKNVIVSLLWGSSVFLIPMLFLGGTVSWTPVIYLLMGAMTVSTLTNTLFSDIRDELGDRMAGTNTLPVLWGGRNCYRLLFSVNAVWLGICAVSLLKSMISIQLMIFFSVLVFYPLGYMLSHRYNKKRSTVVDFLCESDLLIFAGGMALLG